MLGRRRAWAAVGEGRWGERGAWRELERTVAEASSASEDCGAGKNRKRLSSENQDVEGTAYLRKEFLF